MAVRWMGVPAICGGRLREPGMIYDDLEDGTPNTVSVVEQVVEVKPVFMPGPKEDKE